MYAKNECLSLNILNRKNLQESYEKWLEKLYGKTILKDYFSNFLIFASQKGLLRQKRQLGEISYFVHKGKIFSGMIDRICEDLKYGISYHFNNIELWKHSSLVFDTEEDAANYLLKGRSLI